ncbi:hypothetical protein, partial [Paludisphaera soli]|uniref:hypothetical protein n=1 Tax=Paludisphaera soli TaxID=2712865 RepID=UPI0013EB8756
GTELFLDQATTWDQAFQDLNASSAEVDRASRKLCRRPPGYWRDQLPAILAAIEEERGANLAQGQIADPNGYADRETAAAASRTCEVCQGGGLVTVFHRGYDGEPTLHVVNSDGSTSRIKSRFVLACLCPLGRWILAANLRSASMPKYAGPEADRIRAEA